MGGQQSRGDIVSCGAGTCQAVSAFSATSGTLAPFLSIVDSLVSSNRVELPFGGGILVQASSSIQTPVFVKLLGI